MEINEMDKKVLDTVKRLQYLIVDNNTIRYQIVQAIDLIIKMQDKIYDQDAEIEDIKEDYENYVVRQSEDVDHYGEEY